MIPPRDIPVEIKRRPTPNIWACKHCKKIHAYRDHNGVLQGCGFCCRAHGK